MSNREVLEKAIQKATGNGWGSYGKLHKVWLPIADLDTVLIEFVEKFNQTTRYRQFNYEAIIFNRDFAKALWGDGTKEKPVSGGTFNAQPGFFTTYKNWKNHLMDMVVSEDPINYLGENI